MKKNIMKICVLILFVLVVLLFNSSVNADMPSLSDNIVVQGSNINSVDNSIKKPLNIAWNTIRYILQVVAITAFIIYGVKYMIASAEQKADLKKGLLLATIGVILIFGASIVISFVQQVAGDVMKY